MSTPINRLEAAWKAWSGDPNDADKVHDLGRAIRDVVAQKSITMQDVLLACGELNERERVAVQWVLDRVRVPSPGLTADEVIQVVRYHRFRDHHPAESADTYLEEMYDDLRTRLEAAIKNKKP